MVKELVLKNLETKLNLYVSLKISKYGKDDKKIIKPHHLANTAVSISAENWFQREYNKLSRELIRKFVNSITKESVWSLHSIELTDIILQRYDPVGGYGWHPLPKWLANKEPLINPQNDDEDCFFMLVLFLLI